MAPLTKDAVETGNSPQESVVSQSNPQPKSAGGHLRSDAVSLEVPVKVHGSRATEGVRGAAPQMQPFEEQTTTMIVFPQGGVLRMAASVGAGQMLVLTNLKSKQDAICRVLKVRSFPNMQAYVEVEFTQAQPGYWGVYFAADSSAAHAKGAPAAPPAAPAPPEVKQKNDLEVSWAPAPTAPAAPKPIETTTYSTQVKPIVPSAPVPPPAKPVSTFVSIGSQEDVQLAASSTREIKAAPPPEIKIAPAVKVEKESRAKEATPTPVAPVASAELSATVPATSATTLSLEDLRGDDETVSSIFASLDSEAKQSAAGSKAAEGGRPFGSFGTAPALAGEHAAAAGQDFGARLDGGIGAASTAEPRQNWMLIAACIAVLFLAVGGGVLYFRPKPANNQIVATAVPAQQTTTRETTAPSAPQLPVSHPAQSSTPAESSGARISAASPPTGVANAGGTSARNSKPVPAPSQPAAAVDQPTGTAGQPTATVSQPAAASASPNMLANTMNAHPVSSQRAVEQNEAPALDSAASATGQPGDLPGGGSGSIAAPPPPEASSSPLQVGGTVKEPKLISSVPVVYPSVAKNAHVQGDVVIDTQIDKNGNVVHMKAISGPILLRQAALDAVRKWKYQPSTLDGQPVSVDMLVTVKFRP
jgi:periplasmic protein TonB